MKPILTRLSLPLTALLVIVLAVSLRAAEIKPSANWEREMKAFEAADKRNPPPQGAILFVGSSTFARWKTLSKDLPGYTLINRGFGGSQMVDCTYFADRIIFPYKPRLIVVHEGCNDIDAGKSPEQVFQDYKDFVAKVRSGLPNVRILFCAIPPAPVRAREINAIRKANDLIWNYIATQPNMDYVDTFSIYMGKDGQPDPAVFGPDRLHPNAEGYRRRAAVTRPQLGPPDKPVAAEK